jgi:hypothetical protein
VSFWEKELVLMMKMKGLLLCGVAIVLALGCGARSLTGDSGSSEESDGTGGDGGQVPSDTWGTGATSSGSITSTTTSSPTSSTGTTSSSDSTTGIDTSPIPGTWEGVVQRGEWFSYLKVCDFGWACFGSVPEVFWCENVYVRAEGTMRWVEFGGIDGCSGWYLDVDELLEARACEPTDCEAGCTGPVWCEAHCSGAGQECPWGEKCVARAYEGLPDVHPRRCVPLPPEPVAEGEACTVASATDEGYDDCDRGLHCWAEEPTATTGVCVPFCYPGAPETCPSDCVECSLDYEGLCLSDCPGCDLSHSC